MQNKFVTVKYKAIIKKYHIKLHLEVVRGALACESPGESFFLRIYQSFSFSKVSQSNCRSTTATQYSKYKVKKVQTLESISREQDVISLPSHWRSTGRIFRSKATLRNRVLKHMTKNKYLTYLKGANNMAFFAYSRKCTYVG